MVIPYIEGISERVDRVLKIYGETTAMRPYTILRRLLVHPEDKVESEEQCELVYEILCKSCGSTYVGETGRLVKTRLIEHTKDVEIAHREQYTSSEKKRSRSTTKSALTDHTTTENHIIDWEGLNVIDRESHRMKRHAKEAMWICKTSR